MRGRSARYGRRGVVVIIFILMIAVFGGYFMLRHMFSAVQKSKQSIKLFHSTYAMNLAEACINAATNIVRDKINTPDDSADGFYLLFRLPVDKLGSRSTNLAREPVIAEIEKTFGGKIEKLEARFTAVSSIVDKTGANVSLDNVEKCGALTIECHARYADSLVRVETRQDFKVAILREPQLHNYALMIRDAWGEYHWKPQTKYWSTSYQNAPGSHEGYNPKDHRLDVISPSNGFTGKILFGGPHDPDKKIYLDLSDADTDLMKPLMNVKNKQIVKPDEMKWRYTGTDVDLPRADAEKLWNATFDRANFTKDPFGGDYKASIYFSKQNLGYKSKYRFKKLDGSLAAERPGTYFPTEAAATDPHQWANISFLYGGPTFFYESAISALAQQYGHDPDLWTHHRDDPARGINLWGAPGERTPCPVEGNVFARYTSLAYLLWRIEPEGSTYDLYAPFPGGVDFVPSPVDPKDPRNAMDFQVYGAYRTRIDEGTHASVYTAASTRDRAEGLTRLGKPVNCDSEVHVVPYNLLLGYLKMNDTTDMYKNFPDFHLQADNFTFLPAFDYTTVTKDFLIMNKFSAMYDNEREFFEDRMTTDTDGRKTIHLDGKMIVLGDLHLDQGPYQYKGAGTIVALTADPSRPANIFLGSHLRKSADAGTEDTLLTLVATFGKIFVTGDNLETEAALFALSPGFEAGDVETQSFVVGPNKEIQQGTKWKIVGSLCVDRLNLPTFHKQVELVYDPNLAPALNDEERHRDYHVSVSKKYNYWYRGSI